MPEIVCDSVSVDVYSTRTSTSKPWGTGTKTLSIPYELPPNAYATEWRMHVKSTVAGNPCRVQGQPIAKGENDVAADVPEEQKLNNGAQILCEFKSALPTTSTNTSSHTTLTVKLTVVYAFASADVEPPQEANLQAGSSAGDPVTLAWYGAASGTGNSIVGYEIQRSLNGDAWQPLTSITTELTSGSILVYPPDEIGDVYGYRIRTLAELGEDYNSAWYTVPDTLTRTSEGEQMEDVRLPRLYDRDLNELRRLHPSRVSLTLNLRPLSTAEMELPAEEAPDVRQLVELFSFRGSVGFYQVTAVETDIDTNVCTVTMEHAISTLADAVVLKLKGDETGAAMGRLGDVCTQLLEHQTAVTGDGVPYWQFGRDETPEGLVVIYTFANDNLLASLTTLSDQIGSDYYWSFDFRTRPWTINLVRTPAEVCECRLSRNLSTARITTDASAMCTRLYPYGYGEDDDRISLADPEPEDEEAAALADDEEAEGKPEYMDADTIDRYGVIVRTWQNDEIFDVSTLRRVAEAYIDMHREPAVTVELTAIDLSRITGERIDAFGLGFMCRLPLPDYGSTVDERIMSMKWDDLLGDPFRVGLTLANKAQEASDELADLIKRTSAANLVGGKVKTSKFVGKSSGTGGTYEVTYFDIEKTPALLEVSSTYTMQPNAYHHWWVDGVDQGLSPRGQKQLDLMPLLKKDTFGSVVGRHSMTIAINPSVKGTVFVNNVITVKAVVKE